MYPSMVFGISSIGIPSGLRHLAKLPINLLKGMKFQISLHAPFNSLRHELMPGTSQWSISEMLGEAKELYHLFGNSICLNYVVIENVNDDEKCLDALINIAEPKYFYIKLSTLNELPNHKFTRGSRETIRNFADLLTKNGWVVKMFESAGTFVHAGCEVKLAGMKFHILYLMIGKLHEFNPRMINISIGFEISSRLSLNKE